MRLQLGAVTSGCANNGVRLQLVVATNGLEIADTMGVATFGYGKNWMRLQLRAATIGCGCN